MSHLLAEVQARRAAMTDHKFRVVSPERLKPTRDERRVFAWDGLSKESRKVALQSARKTYGAARIYRMIAGSLT